MTQNNLWQQKVNFKNDGDNELGSINNFFSSANFYVEPTEHLPITQISYEYPQQKIEPYSPRLKT